MPYIDDFYSTPSADRAYLEQPCSAGGCTHLRYQHGETRTQLIAGAAYSREVVNAPGKCTGCRCKVFAEPNAITDDDVLDAHEFLEAVTTAAGLGIVT